MKTEDDPEISFQSTFAANAAASAAATGSAGPPPLPPAAAEPASNGRPQLLPTPKRTVCDHCRRRRIRCDGQFPCRQCINASLTCKRDHVPRKRGPKRGHGKVINELRARETAHETHGKDRTSRESSFDNDEEPPSATTSGPSSPTDIAWQKLRSDPRNAPEPRGSFSSDQYMPNNRSYLYLVPRCVELYREHIYPIMPLVYLPKIESMIADPTAMTSSDKNLIYALCALTSMHMSGQSIQASGLRPPSWEAAGRFFLDECISVRHSYDFLEDPTLFAVISSFFLSNSFFEINQSRKSWLYLREALTLALDMGLPDDTTYNNLPPEEKLCRQRVFWILFVTERSFAILRNKPITFKKTPALPINRHPYEAPDIQSGFLQLISSYTPLDESFVAAWNDGSDPRVSATTYLALQNLLSSPPSFLNRSRGTTPSPENATWPGKPAARDSRGGDPDNEEPDPTAIQKADLLMTQQWLRLIVWQSSFRQGLLSWAAPHESMHFAFPLAIARRTASILQSLPSSAIEVHGMGIFEKIFEIGTWCINVLSACDSAVGSGTPISGAGIGMGVEAGYGSSSSSFRGSGGSVGVMGMEFVDANGDFGVLGLSRKGVAVDPLEFFVRTLSASPNSRTQFAERLLMFAGERPGGMRMTLSPALSALTTPNTPLPWGGGVPWDPDNAPDTGGTIIGEVKEEEDDEGLDEEDLSGGDIDMSDVQTLSGAPIGGASEFLPAQDRSARPAILHQVRNLPVRHQSFETETLLPAAPSSSAFVLGSPQSPQQHQGQAAARRGRDQTIYGAIASPDSSGLYRQHNTTGPIHGGEEYRPF